MIRHCPIRPVVRHHHHSFQLYDSCFIYICSSSQMICISCCKIIHFSINITHPPPKPPPEGAPLFCFIVQGSKQNIKCKYKRTHRNEKKVCTLDCSFIKSNIDTPSYQFIIYSPRYHIYHIFLPPSQRKHTFLLSYFQCRRKNISFSLSN